MDLPAEVELKSASFDAVFAELLEELDLAPEDEFLGFTVKALEEDPDPLLKNPLDLENPPRNPRISILGVANAENAELKALLIGFAFTVLKLIDKVKADAKTKTVVFFTKGSKCLLKKVNFLNYIMEFLGLKRLLCHYKQNTDYRYLK